MDRSKAVIFFGGSALIIGASALGYLLGERVERAATSTPTLPGEVSPTPTVTPLASPLASPQPALFPTPTPAVRGATPESPVTLTIESVPATVPSGSPVIVGWRIAGPSLPQGTATWLQAKLEGQTEPVRSKIAGPFSLPARFTATVTPTGSATLHLQVAAKVAGEMLQAEQTLTVTD